MNTGNVVYSQRLTLHKVTTNGYQMLVSQVPSACLIDQKCRVWSTLYIDKVQVWLLGVTITVQENTAVNWKQ